MGPQGNKKQVEAVPQRDIDNFAGIASFTSGVVSIFVLPVAFVPLAFVFGLFAIVKKQPAWGVVGLIFALAGFLMSPVLMEKSGVRRIIADQVQRASGRALYKRMEEEERYELLKQRAVSEMNQGLTVCRQKRLGGELKTYVDSAKCSNPMTLQAFRDADYPYMDLIELFNAKRLELAARLDRKEITEIQAGGEDDKFVDYLSEQALARDQAKAQKK